MASILSIIDSTAWHSLPFLQKSHAYAFEKCTSLSKISIPSSVTLVKEGAFFGCKSLIEISIHSSTVINKNGINSNIQIIKF